MDTYKYQSSFSQALNLKNPAADLLARISFSDKFAPTWTAFCDFVGIQGKTSQTVLQNGRLSLSQLVGWYLYALAQPGIKPAMLPGYLVNRAREGEPPPAPFVHFACLSWGLWVCYGCLLELPFGYQAHFADAPYLAAWLAVYGGETAVKLPLAVREAVEKVLSQLPEEEAQNHTLNNNAVDTNPDESQMIWGLVLEELSLHLPKPTFEMWLRDTQLLRREGQHYWIGVASERARDWLAYRLKQVVQRTLSGIVSESVELEFLLTESEG